MRNKKEFELNLKAQDSILTTFHLRVSPIKSIYICAAWQHKTDARVKDDVYKFKLQYYISKLISDHVKA